MNDLNKNIAQIIKEAAQSPLGFSALVAILFSGIALEFFSNSSESVKVGIFVFMAISAGVFAMKMVFLMQRKSNLPQSNSSQIINEIKPRPSKKNDAKYHIVIICGLSSAGKDSVLAETRQNLPENMKIRFLSKCTSRDLKESELSSDIWQRETAYETHKKAESALLDSDDYFGVYKRENNYYGFAKSEVDAFLRRFDSGAIVGIYSACKYLPDFKVELKRYIEDIGNIAIQDHWVLIDTKKDDCKRRLSGRNLKAKTARTKQRNIEDESIEIRNLYEMEFFDTVVHNSDSDSFSLAVDALTKKLRDYDL